MKLIVLYRQPEDPAAFDAAYAEHLKLADAVPHTTGYTVTRFSRSLAGETLYLMFEMGFANPGAMRSAMGSWEMSVFGKDARQFDPQIISMALSAEE